MLVSSRSDSGQVRLRVQTALMAPEDALAALQRGHVEAVAHPIRGNSYADGVRLVSHQIATLSSTEHLGTVLGVFERVIPARGLAGLSSVLVTALDRASAAHVDYTTMQRVLRTWHSAGLPDVGDGGRDDLIVTRPGRRVLCSHKAAREQPLPTTGDDVPIWVDRLVRAIMTVPGGR